MNRPDTELSCSVAIFIGKGTTCAANLKKALGLPALLFVLAAAQLVDAGWLLG